ncbi:MAG: tyrosine-type recombinase/integrase [Niabella sp.]
MKPTDFSKYLSDYLTQYLPVECGVSPNTIKTYSITFTVLLGYLKSEEGLSPDKVWLKDITKPRVIAFLDWLQSERNCRPSTRNARLATLHSFFRYIQYRDMKGLHVWQEILSIRFKKCASPEMAYLTADGIKLLLKQPDITTRTGRRDLALLGLLYDSAARVQELADLTPSDFRFEGVTTVRLKGKGNKSRIVPLSENQVKNLTCYMQEQNLFEPYANVYPLFSNPQNGKLSRVAILGIVKKHAARARLINQADIPDGIGCHSFRHSKAMHMLEADINLVYIRDFLGHSSTITTEVYARASAQKKLEALKKLNPSIITNRKASWQKDGELLSWLKEMQSKY